MLWVIAFAAALLVLVSVGQVASRRRVEQPKAESSRVSFGKIVTVLAGGALVLLLFRFGLQWIVVAGTGLLGLKRWVFPLLRLLPMARFAARWAANRRDQRPATAEHPMRRAGQMSRTEALKVLGLQNGATPEQVAEAYKNLILKMHPDHGGSAYLASKINEAREVLL